MNDRIYVRWWRTGDSARMSLIHIRNDRGTHDEEGTTACGKTFRLSRVVPPPHFAVIADDGTVDPEDRYCKSCLRATKEGSWS